MHIVRHLNTALPLGTHPQAVLHCFFKSRGYTQSECVMLEMLAEAQALPDDMNNTTSASDNLLAGFVSKRIRWELDASPMDELVELVLNTRATIRRLQHNKSLNDQQRSVCVAPNTLASPDSGPTLGCRGLEL